MELIIPTEVLKRVKDKAISKNLKGIIESPDFKGYQTTSSSDLDVDEYAILRTAAREVAALDDTTGAMRSVQRMATALANKCATLVKIMKDDGTDVYSNLQQLTEALIRYVKTFPNRYIFEITEVDDMPIPYIVTSIYHTAGHHVGTGEDRFYVPARISLNARAIRRGNHTSTSGSFDEYAVEDGATASRALGLLGFVPESDELLKSYRESLFKYNKLRTQVGLLVVVTGAAATTRKRSWWSEEQEVELGVEGKPGRAVMDDVDEFGEDTAVVNLKSDMRNDDSGGYTSRRKSRFGRHIGSNTRDLDTAEDTDTRQLPIYPFVRLFYFGGDMYVETHINNVSEYIFDRHAFDKVVLPEDTKTIVDSIVRSSRRGDDIIAGKGKGIVIMSSGPAGTGKTLTAEAYAERAKKPLYSVQCSQLGTDASDIETNLGNFLGRCRKWNAIGLLDEADVFVRERGDDINQNAIVGVFLRILEYYEGVLFLTTNRESSIDDAVLSRCIVHVRYTVPDIDGMKKVWRIMFAQFDLEREVEKRELPAMLDDLAEAFLGCSPRTIKQLCRLAATMVDLGKALTTDLFLFVAKFKDLERDGTMLLDDLEKKEKRANLKKRAVLKD